MNRKNNNIILNTNSIKNKFKQENTGNNNISQIKVYIYKVLPGYDFSSNNLSKKYRFPKIKKKENSRENTAIKPIMINDIMINDYLKKKYIYL